MRVFVVAVLAVSCTPSPHQTVTPPGWQEIRECSTYEALSTPVDYTQTTPEATDYVRPTHDGDGFELVCNSKVVSEFTCPPIDCPYKFGHSDPSVDAQVTVEVCRAGVDPFLIAAVIEIESAGNVGALSSAGARGLMQLMPATAREVAGDIYYDGIEYNPTMNVRLGVKYLTQLLERYGQNVDYALTAYNRGPTNTDAILAREGKLPKNILEAYANKVQRRRRQR